MAGSRKKVTTAGGGVLVREARKIFRYTDVEPRRPARGATYRPTGEWNGPKGPDGKPKSYIDADGNIHVAPGDNRPYLNPANRPSFRRNTVEEVWEGAKDADGKVYDPNTGDPIDWTPGQPRQGVWDMGHVPGEKYHEKWQEYLDGNLTPEEFREWYNDAANYLPELPSNNRSHLYE